MANDDRVPENSLRDFISGRIVRAGAEEVEAVQPYSRILVEDFGYPKQHIQTRPQFKVKARPSDTKKEYPVDITVFRGDSRDDSDAYIIVECKKKSRTDGRKQLEIYLTLSNASIGVWYNGKDTLYLHKRYEQGGQVFFDASTRSCGA